MGIEFTVDLIKDPLFDQPWAEDQDFIHGLRHRRLLRAVLPRMNSRGGAVATTSSTPLVASIRWKVRAGGEQCRPKEYPASRTASELPCSSDSQSMGAAMSA
jgi:hypothetical protein